MQTHIHSKLTWLDSFENGRGYQAERCSVSHTELQAWFLQLLNLQGSLVPCIRVQNGEVTMEVKCCMSSSEQEFPLVQTGCDQR